MIYSARSELQKSSQRFYESDDRCVFFASFDLRKFWTRLPRLAFTDGFVQLGRASTSTRKLGARLRH